MGVKKVKELKGVFILKDVIYNLEDCIVLGEVAYSVGSYIVYILATPDVRLAHIRQHDGEWLAEMSDAEDLGKTCIMTDAQREKAVELGLLQRHVK